MCPTLELVEQDPAEAGQAWETVVRRLEDEGFAIEPAGPGCLYFDTRGVERLYGGVAGVLQRALAALGSSWDARAGAAERKFAALAAASVARPGQALVVEGEQPSEFLAPLPLSLLPLDEKRYAELEGLGMKTVGQLASLPGSAVAERLGQDGRRAWSLARGGDRRRVRPRRPPAEIAERLEFGEAVGNELTLRRALGDARRADARTAGARRACRAEARALGAARRRRLLAAVADVARADGGQGAAAHRAGPQAGRAAGAGDVDRARARRARRVDGPAARARPAGRRATLGQAVEGGPAPGACERRRGRGVHCRRGRPVVADSRAPSAARPTRLNEPRPALVEAGFDGTPRDVNRRPVMLVREEWRVVDRWWTDDPVSRRYFDLVLEGRRALRRLPRRGTRADGSRSGP